jgi:lipopolysaccharide/colanic/teichoic acid biosynthesis glycosyltransferase
VTAPARPLPADPRPRAARAFKRAIDLAAGSALLVLAAPVLGLACVAIRVESRGSPVYRHRRVGKDGVEFDLLKLRTMVSGAERIGAGLAVDEGDPRITRVGALLRRLSLDELPNLVNVLRGEMSLVGPRPTVQVQVSQYSARQLGRLSVEPGITGWAQVKGRAALPWHERIELDLWYIEHWSLPLDARILGETVRLLVTGQGLYRGPTGGWRPPPRA